VQKIRAGGAARLAAEEQMGVPGLKRWSHKIDIYMGEDVRRALRWGRRKVTIHWSSN
jgi:3D (Asp-Asp-Asp) domain-containing protein